MRPIISRNGPHGLAVPHGPVLLHVCAQNADCSNLKPGTLLTVILPPDCKVGATVQPGMTCLDICQLYQSGINNKLCSSTWLMKFYIKTSVANCTDVRTILTPGLYVSSLDPLQSPRGAAEVGLSQAAEQRACSN